LASLRHPCKFQRVSRLGSVTAATGANLRPSLAFSYIASATAQHSSSGHQPNFTAWYKEWNYRTSVEGATYIRQGSHHVGHQPTF